MYVCVCVCASVYACASAHVCAWACTCPCACACAYHHIHRVIYNNIRMSFKTNTFHRIAHSNMAMQKLVVTQGAAFIQLSGRIKYGFT